MADPGIFLPPTPEQYQLLENFSPTTAENVNTTTRVLAINEFLRDLDLGNQIDTLNGIIPEISTDDGASVIRQFDITPSGGSVNVAPGICVLKDTVIETTSIKNLVITNLPDSYLYEGSGDVVPSTDGTHVLMVAIKYTPTEPDPDAYIGLINDTATHYTPNEADLLILGFIQVEVSSGGTVYTIDDVRDTQILNDDYPNSVGLRRENFNVLDSGVLT